MKNKKLLWIFIISALFLIFSGALLAIRRDSGADLSKMEYRVDVEPLKNHFSILENITVAYWKSGSYGKSSIGPSDTWLKGFVLLNDTTFNNIQSGYNWNEVKISFEEGMNPDITGFNNFEWYSSKEFSKHLHQNVFMGDFYLDKKNRVLYFDLSTY